MDSSLTLYFLEDNELLTNKLISDYINGTNTQKCVEVNYQVLFMLTWKHEFIKMS